MLGEYLRENVKCKVYAEILLLASSNIQLELGYS